MVIRDNVVGGKIMRSGPTSGKSFRQMLEGLSNFRKKLADAFIEMMDSKFKFDPSFNYFDPGKGGK